MATLHDYAARTIGGDPASLGDFSGTLLLVVNVASKCGLTPHYQGLEELHRRYQARGFAVLGFPCNQFGGQEPGSEPEIAEFCRSRYDVTFPLFAKIEVNGAGRHPAYAFLTGAPSRPEGSGDIRWNFTKFLVGRDGEVLARFAPQTDPLDAALVEEIEKAL
jgi:glutathione peroxidase